MTQDDLRRFKARWDEYEDTVTRLLPRCEFHREYDLSDDLDHALFCRDTIESTFDAYPDDPVLVNYRTRVLGIDADFILLRRAFFDRYPLDAYRAARERAGVPRSHWWWYLDEVDSVPLEPIAHSPAAVSSLR